MDGPSGSGFAKVIIDIEDGEGGGDGVVDVERKVSPRGVKAGDAIWVSESRSKLLHGVRSNG